MSWKNLVLRSAKAAIVGAATQKVARTVLPKAIPGGVVALLAVQVASKILKKK